MSVRETITIRDATAGEVESLLKMMRLFNANEGIDIDRARLARGLGELLERPDLGFVLMACAGDEPLGYAVLTFGFDLEFGGRDAFLTEIYVRTTWRRAGIGRRLLDAIEQRALESGVAALHLAVRPENAPAFDLYRSAGFEPVPRSLLSKRLETRTA